MRWWALAATVALAACGGADAPPQTTFSAADGGAQARVAVNTELPLRLSVAQDSEGAPALPAGVEAIGSIQQFTPMGLTATGLEISVPFNAALMEPQSQPLLLVAQPGGSWQVVSASLGGARGNTRVLVAPVAQLGYAVVVQAPAGGAPAADGGKAKSAGTSPSLSPSQPRISLNLQSSEPALMPSAAGKDIYSVSQPTTLVQSVAVTFSASCAPKVQVYGVLTKVVNKQLSSQVFTLDSRAYPVGSSSAAFTVRHPIGSALNGSFTTFASATCSQTVPGSALNRLLSRLPAVALGQYYAVTVQAAGAVPAITQAPQNTSVEEGASVTFQVSASGAAPLAYQWQRSDSGADAFVNVGSNAPSLTLTPTLADDASLWRVIVSNASGQVTSSLAQLSVSARAITVAPSITSQPVSSTVVEGQNASFSVAASGTPAPSIQWQSRAFDASNTETGWADIAGATQASYTTPATTLADNQRQVRARISNSAGSLNSAAATLSVTAQVIAPAITQQPVGAEVIEGASADFSVAASGTSPLSYQWFKDGVALVGANGAAVSIATTAADASKTLSITVRVSNSAGQVSSQAASLVVRAVDTGTVSGLINAAAGGSLETPSGVVLEVPAGALNGDATLSVRTQAPSAFTLPAGFTPLGDVVTISTGGALLNQPLYLSFPDPEQALPPDTILVLAEVAPMATFNKASATSARPRVRAAAIIPGASGIDPSALKGGRVTLDVLREGTLALGAAAAEDVARSVGLSDPRRAQLPGTTDTACKGNDFNTKDGTAVSDESVLQSRHTACAASAPMTTSVINTDPSGNEQRGDITVSWKWSLHGPSTVLGKSVRLSFDYTYVRTGGSGTTTAAPPVLKVLAWASCNTSNVNNNFNPASVNCSGSTLYDLNSGARGQGKDFNFMVDWDDTLGRKIAEFQPQIDLYYTTDGTTPRRNADGSPAAGTQTLDNSNMQVTMRCDKGQVWGTGSGCVFPKAAAVLSVDGTPQSAQHMREALAANPNMPGRYQGLKAGTKAVADDSGIATGLQRLRVASLINANRSKIQRVCTALPSPPPAGGSCPLVTDANVDTDAALELCDCDEFPFASSREGAAMPRTYGEASAKYIGRSDNRRAGAQLGAMLRRERIFDPYDHKRMGARNPVFDPDTAMFVEDPRIGEVILLDPDSRYNLDFESRYWIAY